MATNKSAPTSASKRKPTSKAAALTGASVATAESVISQLKELATRHTLDGMSRYGIPSEHAFGVAVGDMRKLAKQLGRNQDLANALWKTGFYEARMIATFLGEPARVTPALMDKWCKDFDSWALCDTACFDLFDKTPHAYAKVAEWAERKNEFEKRAGFALLASLAGHDKKASDAQFSQFFPLIERAAHDERNFVKKAVSWALRRIGTRSPALKKSALTLAKKLAASSEPSVRWVGKDAVRDLSKSASK